jgi:hypothetical protein
MGKLGRAAMGALTRMNSYATPDGWTLGGATTMLPSPRTSRPANGDDVRAPGE